MIKRRSGCAGIFLILSGAFLFFPAVVSAEPLTLKNAVELALRHANGAAIAVAEQKSVAADYRDMRNSYLPQVMVGSGLGPSYGYPLALAGSAPAIFNVTAQSALFHPELQSFIHSASSEFAAAGFRTKDERNQIIQDTVLSYAELEKWEQRLDRLGDLLS